MVEVAGIEPASESHTQEVSTCLFQYLDLAAKVSTEQDTRTTIPLWFRLGATDTPFDYPTLMTICPSPWEGVGRSLAVIKLLKRSYNCRHL